MPSIDVSDVIADPDISVSVFTVLRRRETVDNFGDASFQTQQFQASGAVYPSGDNSLIRQEAMQTGNNTVTVVTSYPLRLAAKDPATGYSFQPDIVVWEGENYLVKSINEFRQYGAGFVEAECVSMDLPSPLTGGPVAQSADFSNPSNSEYLAILGS
jgi:hypothetical protein